MDHVDNMRSLVNSECDAIEAEPRHRGPAMNPENADIKGSEAVKGK